MLLLLLAWALEERGCAAHARVLRKLSEAPTAWRGIMMTLIEMFNGCEPSVALVLLLQLSCHHCDAILVVKAGKAIGNDEASPT